MSRAAPSGKGASRRGGDPAQHSKVSFTALKDGSDPPKADWIEWSIDVLEGLDCPRSLTAAIMIRYGDFMSLAELKAFPDLYADSDSFYRAYQASELLRKFPGLPLDVDTELAAWKGWEDAEAICYKTNERLSPYLEGVSHPECDERVLAILQEIRQEVIEFIGRHPPSLVKGVFGPGATVSDPSRACTLPDKLSSTVSMTPDAWPWLVPWSGTAWATAVCEDRAHLVSSDLSKVIRLSRGNVWFCARKDATIDRSCAKEPSLNAYYQRGYGVEIARFLKKRGFDLRILPEAHKQMAKFGSLTGRIATLDLKTASDTIATNLVKLSLPAPWFEALDSLRSKFTLQPKGGWRKLEKFSSMGNGFTFELETLLFLCISRVAARHASTDEYERWSLSERVTVFGDDIIVPTEAAENVMSLFAFLGLTPNKRKTFIGGEFRESCGGDFYRGEAVRPYLLKEIPNEPQHWIAMANGLRRTIGNLRDADCARRVRLAWFRTLDVLPRGIRQVRGPADLGDIVIHDDERYWGKPRWQHSIRYLRTYSPVRQNTVRWTGFGGGAQLAAVLYLAGTAVWDGSGKTEPFLDSTGRLSERDSVCGYRLTWTPYS